MGITVSVKGDWSKTFTWLRRMDGDIFSTLDQFAQDGVAALRGATPVMTGLASSSWTYDIVKKRNFYSIRWRNTDIENGAPIIILLQHGHGTRQGGYVHGRDFINPAIRPVFERIDAEMRKVVSS